MISPWHDRHRPARSPWMIALLSVAGLLIATGSAAGQALPNPAGDGARFEAVAADYRRQGDRLNEAIALANASLAWQRAGRWPEAKQAIAASLVILRGVAETPEQQAILARSLDLQGQLQRSTGAAADAVQTWQAAEAIYATLNRPTDRLRLQLDRARALQDLGLIPRACETLLTAFELAAPPDAPPCSVPAGAIDRLRDAPLDDRSPLRATGLTAIGNLLRGLGRFAEAETALRAALALADRVGSNRSIAAVRLSLFNLDRAVFEQELGEPETLVQRRAKPIAALQTAIGTADRAGASDLALQARLNGLSFLLSSRRDRPLTPEESALVTDLQAWLLRELPQAAGDRAGIYSRLHYAKAWIDDWPIDDPAAVGDQDLVGLVEQAIALAERAGDRRAQAYGLGLLGKLRDRAGANDAARGLTEQALSLASQVQAPEIAYRLWWQLGQLETRQGNRPSAIAAYNQAIDTLRSVRTDLAAASADVQYSFRETVEPIYRELAGLLLRPDADRDELDQARKIIEGLQLAELDNFFRDACSTARPVRIDEIDSQAAAIYTIILDDRLEAIAALPNGQLLRHTTRMPRAEILAAINEMRGSINKPVLTFLRQGYDWLIRPFEAQMAAAGVKNLVFVLDGELRSVPPAALHDGTQFAIEKYVIAIAPGLQFLPSSRATRSTQNPLLAAGISEARQGFAALPNVPTELQEITQNLPGTVLLDLNFTEPNFLARLENQPFPIVHIATHGQFSSNADRTFLLTWDGRINSRDLDQLFRLPNRDRIPIDLLVLSACTTAKGDSRAALGLAGVSVRAGARTTLATLWQVNDAATAALISRFYQALLDGQLSKGEALRQAQRSLIADPKTRLPFYWAAFILVGDWQ